MSALALIVVVKAVICLVTLGISFICGILIEREKRNEMARREDYVRKCRDCDLIFQPRPFAYDLIGYRWKWVWGKELADEGWKNPPPTVDWSRVPDGINYVENPGEWYAWRLPETYGTIGRKMSGGQMITLLNYEDEKVEFDVDIEADDVLFAMIRILTGDEILEVVYRDARMETYDSDVRCRRICDFEDGAYTVVSLGEWKVDREKFLARKSSYDWERW